MKRSALPLFWGVGLGTDVFEPVIAAGVAEVARPVAGAVVGHDADDLDAEALVVGQGRLQEGDGAPFQRIWRAHGLAPHRIRAFRPSNDPKFAAKIRDIVGLYVDPPAHAAVLSVREVPDPGRTQPGLPLKKGRAGTMTHDYKRNGTTTLIAAFDVLEGKVIGRCMQRHRRQEFIRFLNAAEREVPAGNTVHAILDNDTTHKHPKVIEWLGRHPRWTFQ